MAFCYDENGDVTLVHGDSGSITFEDLPTDKNYKVYVSVYNKDRELIGSERSYNSNYQPIITISFPVSVTDLLTVDKDNDYEVYFYGIKICDPNTGTEDTLLLGDKEIGDLNVITVFPKCTEGLT